MLLALLRKKCRKLIFWIVLVWFIKYFDYFLILNFLMVQKHMLLFAPFSEQSNWLHSQSTYWCKKPGSFLSLVLKPIVCFSQLLIAQKTWRLWVWKEVFHHYVWWLFCSVGDYSFTSDVCSSWRPLLQNLQQFGVTSYLSSTQSFVFCSRKTLTS